MEILVMTEEQAVPEEEVQEPSGDGRIVVIMSGDGPVPTYVDFVKVTPFHLIAIGEWLSLKGRQLIAMAENAEIEAKGVPNILVPSMDEQAIQDILGVKK
jgi:hypothetical protein